MKCLALHDGTGSKVGTGGMQSKLFAAKYAMNAGVDVFIGTGEGAKKLLEILETNGDGTYFTRNDKVHS